MTHPLVSRIIGDSDEVWIAKRAISMEVHRAMEKVTWARSEAVIYEGGCFFVYIRFFDDNNMEPMQARWFSFTYVYRAELRWR